MARNTAVLFARQALILAINLYTVRALLATLGIDDFALLNVIISIVMIGAMLSGSLSMAVQRYYASAIGGGDPAHLRRVYDTSLILGALVIAAMVLALETGGLWFLTDHLVVAPERVAASHLLFQLTILNFVFGGVAIYYQSILMSHEDMHVFALVSVADGLARLGAVSLLGFVAADRLTTYGLLLCLISAGSMMTFLIYCTRNYAECRPRRIAPDFAMLREMIAFTGWTVIGQVTLFSRNQVITILINQHFNPVTVAARALAVSISTQVMTFSTNFSSALNPPIVKAHAAGRDADVSTMIFTGSKVTFFLIWIASLPILCMMPGILRLWLGDYPPEAVIFTRLGLVENAIAVIGIPLTIAVRATGQIRLYEICLGVLQLLILILSWALIDAGRPAETVYIVAIAISVVILAAQLVIAGRRTRISVLGYARNVLAPVGVVALVSSGLALLVLRLVPQAADLPLRLDAFAAAGLIGLLTPGVIYLLGLTTDERAALTTLVQRRLAAITNR